MNKKIYPLLLLTVLFGGCKKETTDIRQPEAMNFNTGHLKTNAAMPFWDQVVNFYNMDARAMPPTGGILFMGSSTIRLWPNLEKKYYAGLPIIKRGLGGSQMAQFATIFSPYLFRYKPAKIFLYAGGNDIETGQTPEQVAASFDSVYFIINRRMPQTNLYYLSMKISPKMIDLMEQFKKANSMIKASIDTKPKAHYLDVTTLLAIDSTGTPNPKYYSADYVHLNAEGYAALEKALLNWVK